MQTPAQFVYLQLVCMRGYQLSPVRDWPDFRRDRRFAKSDLLVVPNGGHMTCVDVLGNMPDLFKQFVKCNSTPNSILEFTERFGVLEDNTLPLKPGGDLDNLARLWRGMSIKQWLKQQKEFAEYLKQLKKEKGSRQRRLDLGMNGKFVWDYDRKTRDLALVVRPVSLLDALYCQAFLAEFVRANDRVCEHCGGFFSVGSRSAKRSDARFCSRECKDSHRNDRTRKAAAVLTER
jgi:hypothetical protein